ncbi:MAG TPA: CHASE3 domain-containing protein, partial [Polyangiaceae bacterium]
MHKPPPLTDDSTPALRLAALGLAALVALCAMAAYSYGTSLRWVEHTVDVRTEIDEWVVAMIEAQSRARGYALSGDPAYLELFAASSKRGQENLARLRRLVADSDSQRRSLDEAARDAEKAQAASRELIELKASGRAGEAALHA